MREWKHLEVSEYGLEFRGYEKWRLFLQKAHPCVHPRRLSHFSVGASRVEIGKKSESHARLA